MATAVDVTAAAPAPTGGRRWAPARWAALTGLVAMVCAVLLPLAPVEVDTPVVTWPLDPAAPRSTLLTTTAHRPLDITVAFGCDVVRAAQAAPGGVVLATVPPGSPDAGTTGLLVTATEGRVRATAYGRLLLDDAAPAGPCEYRITGSGSGRPVAAAAEPSPSTRFDPAVPLERTPPDPARFAGPSDAELRVLRDGTELARTAAQQLPEVAVLLTDVPALPAADVPLAVELRLDDESASRPAPVKVALIAALLGASAATAILLLVADRRVQRTPRRRGSVRPRVVDVVVPGAMVLWLVVAPATDDDGYFATQARNAVQSGEIGNYFQLFDQSYTPFTWVYQGLSWWQQLAGYAPVAQRVPALVAGLLTWLLARRVLAMILADAPGGRLRNAVARGVLGVAFLAWWLPYDMGVRPEAVVALCAVAALHGVLVAGRRGRLAAAWWACAVAGAGFVAHPSGIVAVAPLLAGLPILARCVTVPSDRGATVLRALAVASGGSTALLLGFADGALRDFLRGQLVTESVYPQDGWADELERYAFLLDQIPMGSYAKRAAVLACLLALAWFTVLAVAARARRTTMPASLLVTGIATGLSFVALAVTPSKWTHHFGSIAGVGSVLLAAMLTLGVPLAREMLRGARTPIGPALAVAVTVAVGAALTWRGPNSWSYAWLEGMPSAYRPPNPAGIALDHPLLWGLVLAVVTAVLLVARRAPVREAPAALLRAGPAVLVVSLAVSTVHLLTTFTIAAASGTPRDTVWAGSFADPAGTSCVVGDALHVLDPGTARPLDALTPAPPAGIFVPGRGYYGPNPPQGSATAQVWGSLDGRDGRPAEEPTGAIATAWYRLPEPASGTVTVIAAGTLDAGNQLTAAFGRTTGTEPVSVGTQPLTDAARTPSWRTFALTPPAGADSVRIEAVDALTGRHGWLAFSAPVVARPVAVSELAGPDVPVAVAWQVAFGFPCLRPVTVAHGVTEPPELGVLRAGEPLGGLGDVAWQGTRGGVFAQVLRTRSVLQLATVAPADPYLQVYVFGSPLARDAYTLDVTRRTVPGGSTDVR